MSWISQGYFVGPSAVKVRSFQVKSDERKESSDGKDDVQAMIADLDDSDEEIDEKPPGERSEGSKSNWVLSDEVDFKSYLTGPL